MIQKSFYANKLIKYSMSLLATYFIMSSPAHAITLGEIMQTIADQANNIKTAGVVIFGVVAFFCIGGAATIFYKKSKNDPHVKLSSAAWLVLAALLFGGTSFWLSTFAESAKVEMTTY